MRTMRRDNEINKLHGIHITHNDADAVGCALVASKFYDDYDFEDSTYFCAIGSQDKVLKNVLEKDIENNNIPKTIIISDIFLEEETCEYLEKVAKEHEITLLGFDHHATNNLNEKYDWFIVNKEKVEDDRCDAKVDISAAKVMMDYYKNKYDCSFGKCLEIAIDMISRYDTWEWKNHPFKHPVPHYSISEDIIAVITKYLGVERTFKDLYNYYTPSPLVVYSGKIFPELFFTIYDIEKEREERSLSRLDNQVRIVELFKYTVAIFISTDEYSNACADYLNNTYPFVDMTMIIYPSSRRLGFRTKSNKINVGEFAKKYFNGGGHPKASGAVVDDSTMSSVMELYYIIGDSIDEYLDDSYEY